MKTAWTLCITAAVLFGACEKDAPAPPPAETPAAAEASAPEGEKPSAESAKAEKAEASTETPKEAKVETPKPAPVANTGDIPAPADVAAAPADATTTASGLASKVIQAGTGTERPSATDTVKVHYTGWTADGKMFDSSVKRGAPASFPLNRVIKGWTEGLQLMVQGEKRRFWIPGNLAYGDTPRRPGAPAGTLVFDVELLDVVKPQTVEAPADVSAPPADAVTTASGLIYKVIKKGAGGPKPTATSTVQVHYSGWTKDGKLFDSSVQRGQPASFPLNRVIKGWTEGVQLMGVGDTFRFWIPGSMAYGDTPARPGAPAGQLTFDVELLNIM